MGRCDQQSAILVCLMRLPGLQNGLPNIVREQLMLLSIWVEVALAENIAHVVRSKVRNCGCQPMDGDPCSIRAPLDRLDAVVVAAVPQYQVESTFGISLARNACSFRDDRYQKIEVC